MAKIIIPTPLRKFTDNQSTFETSGNTIKEAVAELIGKHSGLAKNARAATAIFPIMRQATIVRSWAGIEGVMPDNIPVIGAGSANGVYHAFGFSAHGFALGPLVGKIITDLIDGGDIELPIDAFRIRRFSQNKDT